jgi:hypothetical protein
MRRTRTLPERGSNMKRRTAAAAILLAVGSPLLSVAPSASSAVPEGGRTFVCHHGLIWIALQTLLGFSSDVGFLFENPDCYY